MPESITFKNIAKLESRGHWGIKRGLENPKALLKGLGHPENHCPVVLIAGTNGKGSTGAFLAQALKSCGINAGWTTSPHLVSPRERIAIDGRFLSESMLDALLEEVFACEAALGLQATYFELMIAAATLGFRQENVELALLEVGMGGRWDATNASNPVLTVLTNVALDHTQYLGDTREAIAREKLCTARSGRPLVLGPALDVPWVKSLLENDPVLCPVPPMRDAQVFWDHSIVCGAGGARRIALAGEHQLDNLATALEALRQLRILGISLPEEPLWEGLSAARWPGRLWQLPGKSVWMDGAHNPDGAQRLAQHARRCFVRPHVFFGAMGDKDLEQICVHLRQMEPASLTFIKGENERYATPEQLRAAWRQDAPVLTPAEAALCLEKGDGVPTLVTGSLFLIGDLLRALGISPELS